MLTYSNSKFFYSKPLIQREFTTNDLFAVPRIVLKSNCVVDGTLKAGK